MELHELRIADACARLHGQAKGVAGVLVPPRGGAPPDPRVAACGEDHRIRPDDVARAVPEVESVGAEDHVVADEELRDVQRVEDRHLQLLRAAHEDALDLQARVVAGERRAAEGVRAEEPL
jgi:hypothetical protein